MDIAAAFLSITLRLVDLHRPRIVESVTVIAMPRSVQTPAAVTTLWRESLETSPAATLDDALRSVPGFSLFRRSSSRVANPTTQGVTLRGLAASGSSRALVLEDRIPLNDPVGGWVYWNRIPAVALQNVSVKRGAGGDVPGPDAIGGAIYISTSADRAARLLVEGGDHRSARVSGYGGTGTMFGAAEWFTTEGFVIVAPESRGVIDTHASSRHGSGRVGAHFSPGPGDIVVKASHFDERRGNGTPYQRNQTRITQGSFDAFGWRRTAWGWGTRAYVLTQRYEQTFSAVLPGRSSERPTSEQNVEASTAGASADLLWSTSVGKASLTAAGRYVASELSEMEFAADGAVAPARIVDPAQMTAATGVQGSYLHRRFTFGGGVRAELWQSQLGAMNRHFFVDPRVWITRSGRLTWNAAFQSGYRGPTINELYRPFRVGNVLTQANPLLEPERARGIEAGVMRPGRVTARALAFWSRIDDAILNVTLSSGGGTILRQRQNAARIRAAGIEIEVDARLTRTFTLTASSSFTDSVFVAGPLEGLRVPQVPRAHHAAGMRVLLSDVRFSADWRYIGRQFDDDRNVFALARSSMIDARVGWGFRRGMEIFAAVENLLDQEQDVGRTPLRTIGLPRMSRIGLRIAVH
jgi:outer membrane receptor protein involved in Fe transport